MPTFILISIYGFLYLSFVVIFSIVQFQIHMVVFWASILLIVPEENALICELLVTVLLIFQKVSVLHKLYLVEFRIQSYTSFDLLFEHQWFGWAYCISSKVPSFNLIQTLAIYNFLQSLLPIQVESKIHLVLAAFYLAMLGSFGLMIYFDLNCSFSSRNFS